VLTRHSDPRVIPLELWDVLVDGVPLHTVPRGPGFGAELARVVDALAAGTARTPSGTRFPAVARQLERVVLAGGLAREVAWPAGATPAAIASEPGRCSERGGLAILARAGRRGLVIDLGQSTLKIATCEHRFVSARDLLAIPPNTGRGREVLVDWVANALAEAARAAPPDALVFALPCEVSPLGRIGTCSYPWAEGDDIVLEILDAAGLSRVPAALLNDAELAAIGVADAGAGARTLVLTLGFGVGGALLL